MQDTRDVQAGLYSRAVPQELIGHHTYFPISPTEYLHPDLNGWLSNQGQKGGWTSTYLQSITDTFAYCDMQQENGSSHVGCKIEQLSMRAGAE